MAYPTVSAPYGLKPVNLIGGQVFAGATRQMEIASGYSTNIFYGDLVKRISDGTIEKDTGTTTATPCGVFLGVSFTNSSTGQVQQQQFYPASTVASDIVAYVCDDPDTYFKVAVLSGASTIGGMTQTDIGNNVAILVTAGNTTFGDSNEGVSATTGSTTTLPFRVIAGVPETVNASGSFTEVIVKFNFGVHTYYSAAAVATAA